MQTPTPVQINTAIEVLKKYAERLNEQATHSAIQMPDSRLGADYAARIQSQAIGQISNVEARRRATDQLAGCNHSTAEEKIFVMFYPKVSPTPSPAKDFAAAPWPRNRRAMNAPWPLSRTRTRTGRGRELVTNWPQTRTGQNCGLAVTSARPRTQTRTRSGHEFERTAATTSPQTSRGRGLDKERPFFLKIIFIHIPPFYVRI